MSQKLRARTSAPSRATQEQQILGSNPGPACISVTRCCHMPGFVPSRLGMTMLTKQRAQICKAPLLGGWAGCCLLTYPFMLHSQPLRVSLTQPLQPTHVYVHFAKALYTQPFHLGTTQTLQRAAASFPTPPSALQTSHVSTHRSRCPGAPHTATASPAAQHRPSSSCKAHQGLWLFHNISTLQAFKKKKKI